MAKAKSINYYIDKVFENYEEVIKTAVINAGKEARDDILWRAKECVYEYYDNYEPSIYDRTDTLIRSVKPYMRHKVFRNGKLYGIQVGVWYDPNELVGQYYGSEKYSPVDPMWVIDNYLQGIHPRTDGGINYEPVIDPVSPQEKMESYLETYRKTMSQKVLSDIVKQIRKVVK